MGKKKREKYWKKKKKKNGEKKKKKFTLIHKLMISIKLNMYSRGFILRGFVIIGEKSCA